MSAPFGTVLDSNLHSVRSQLQLSRAKPTPMPKQKVYKQQVASLEGICHENTVPTLGIHYLDDSPNALEHSIHNSTHYRQFLIPLPPSVATIMETSACSW